MDLPLGNQESSSYGMNVTGPIFVNKTQMLIMKVLHANPEMSNRTIGERIGRTRSSVQTALVDLYCKSGLKNRGELIAVASLMVEKDGRGRSDHLMVKTHRLGLAYPPDDKNFYQMKTCYNRKVYTNETRAKASARQHNCTVYKCVKCNYWHCKKNL